MEHRRPLVALGRLPLDGKLVHQIGIGLVPVRAFPPAAFEEHGTELMLPRIEGADPNVTRGQPRLRGMQHVVDLDEVLLRGFADVRGIELEILEAVDVASVQLDLGSSVDQQLCDGPADSGRVRHPHGLGDPEALDVRGFTEQRSAVGGEREDSVEAVVDLGGLEARQQQLGLLPRRREVLLREVEHGRHRLVGHTVSAGQGLGVDGHRAVRVGSDAETVDVLAEVQVLILMTKNGHAGLGRFGVASHQFRDLIGLGVLVRQGQQRHLHADQFAHIGAPEAGAGHHDVGLDDAVVGCHTGDAATRLFDTDDLGGTTEHGSARFCATGECHDGTGRFGKTVGLDVQTAENPRTIDQRM